MTWRWQTTVLLLVGGWACHLDAAQPPELPVSNPASNPAPNPTPNIVVIIADDLGWADVGYHGSRIETPHLDRLAQQGVRLSQFYVYPTCSPTRAALLTGRNPNRHGILGPIGGNSRQHPPPDALTLPRALSDHGYTTHLVGKWHLGLDRQFGPLRYGFETSYGYLHGQIDPYTHRYKFGDRTWHRNDEFLDEQGHATDLITAEAVRVMESDRSRPFYLQVAYSVPHFPLNEPAEWQARYTDTFDDPWRAHYAASVSHMDAGIGQIVAALDDAGLAERTLLVFFSDNGGQQRWTGTANQYDGRYQPHTTLGRNDPLRGWKGDLYEGGIRVPALARWPGKLPSGTKAESPASVLDWLPTFCALAGEPIDSPNELEGENIWPLLTGRQDADERTMYWRTGSESAVRRGPWKLIAKAQGGSAELYHLADDPHEESNLAETHPDQVAALRQILQEQRSGDR
ncbi:MAG: sulfatase [Pirellulales bacterium]